MPSKQIQQLKEQISAFQGVKREALAFSAVEGGFSRGSLVELSGPAGCGKTELILKFLAEHPKLRVAWVEDEFTVYPICFPQFSVSLNRVLFAQCSSPKNALWSAHQMMRSQIFEILVLGASIEEEIDLRRLQIGAEKSATLIFILNASPRRQSSWPISIQLEVRRGEKVPLVMTYVKGGSNESCLRTGSR